MFFAIILAGVLGGVIVGGTMFYMNKGSLSVLPAQTVGDRAIKYINDNVLAEGVTASLVSIAQEGNIYKIKLKIANTEYDSFITTDGKFLFPEGYAIDIAPENTGSNGQAQSNTEVVKSDKPDVKIFVMSYCPFGLQAQKMMLPVYDLLKDKVDIGVYFVDYAMHEKKEIDENLNQYCIQAEQKDKYAAYLSCFVSSTNGDSAKCMTEAKIDKTKLASCISATDKKYEITKLYNDKSTWVSGSFPQFNVHKDLNDQYGVQGSPTIVINGAQANIGSRTPENLKKAICDAFNVQPAECTQKLSESAPTSGFGTGTTAGTSGGGCGQ